MSYMEIAITPTNAERLKEMQSIWERFNELYYDIKMDSQFYDLLDAENRRLTMENSLMQRELEKHGIRFENLETKETRINLKPLNAVQQNFLKKILVGIPISTAAKQVGITDAAARKWLEDPSFISERTNHEIELALKGQKVS